MAVRQIRAQVSPSMSDYAHTTNNTPTILEPVIYFRVSAFALAAIALLGLIMNATNGNPSTALGFSNTFLNFTWSHDVVHLVLAAAAFLFGFAALPGNTVKLFAMIFGVVYLALGVAGFFVWGNPSVSDYTFLALTPGLNIVHIALGGYAIVSGAMAKYS